VIGVGRSLGSSINGQRWFFEPWLSTAQCPFGNTAARHADRKRN